MPNEAASVWDGLPSNPERDGWHWVADDDGALMPDFWNASRRSWISIEGEDSAEHYGDPEQGFIYLGPCLTPSEHTAALAAAGAAGEARGIERAIEAIGPVEQLEISQEAWAYAFRAVKRIRALTPGEQPALAEALEKARAEEREACAAQCNESARRLRDASLRMSALSLDSQAVAIRARGEKGEG